MSLQSVDRPVALAHRPMSLLLQALRQIETKAPPQPSPIAPTDVSLASSTAIQSAATIPEPHSAIAELSGQAGQELPYGGRYETIRVYEPSEIASELAVAGPARLASVPLVEASLEPTPAKTNSRTTRRRLADELVGLLPDECRSVIALTSMDGSDLWPLANELCNELAESKRQPVVAVARLPRSRRSVPTAGPLSMLYDDWHALLCTDPPDGFSVLDRRQLETARDVSCRALLDLWGRMLDEFAYIVVDAASGGTALKTPMLATSDATFLVVRLGDTGRRQVEQELDRIRAIGGRPCGCLVA